MFLCASIFCSMEQTISHLSKMLNRFKHCVYSVCTCVLRIEWEIIKQSVATSQPQTLPRAANSSIHVCDMYGVCVAVYILMFTLRILKNNGLNSSVFFVHIRARTIRLYFDYLEWQKKVFYYCMQLFNFTRTFWSDEKKMKLNETACAYIHTWTNTKLKTN